MARTPLFSALRRSALLALEAHRQGVPASEQVARERARAWSRRQLLKAAAVTAGAALTFPSAPACAGAAHAGGTCDARIAIVGGGIAGLLCAYRLKQAGVRATVYEAGTRTGGRIHSLRGGLADDQHVELGGEFIDTGHSVMHGLAREFGLQLDDLDDDPAVRAQSWFFENRLLDPSAIVEAFVPVALRMQADLEASERDAAAFARIDALSIEQWLDGVDELDPVLRALLMAAYVGEYGRELDEQSAFNLLWLIDSAQPEPFRIFGDSDERFHVRGGNDQIPVRLARELGDQVELERRLVRARELDGGRFRLSFERDGRAVEHDVDRVVFALPWTQLRGVELELNLPPEKSVMIAQLGYGTNAKLIGQFDRRVWRERHMASGSGFTDLSMQTFWESSRKQPGDAGLFTVFLGGRAGAEADVGSAEQRMRAHLPDIERVFPGSTAAYRTSSAIRAHWPSEPLFMGSYACYLPGQATWSGSEGEAHGAVHFCGEHTSEDFQGYMEGAAESGERAASEVLGSLRP